MGLFCCQSPDKRLLDWSCKEVKHELTPHRSHRHAKQPTGRSKGSDWGGHNAWCLLGCFSSKEAYRTHTPHYYFAKPKTGGSHPTLLHSARLFAGSPPPHSPNHQWEPQSDPLVCPSFLPSFLRWACLPGQFCSSDSRTVVAPLPFAPLTHLHRCFVPHGQPRVLLSPPSQRDSRGGSKCNAAAPRPAAAATHRLTPAAGLMRQADQHRSCPPSAFLAGLSCCQPATSRGSCSAWSDGA